MKITPAFIMLIMAPFVMAQQTKCNYQVFGYKDNTCTATDEQTLAAFTITFTCEETLKTRDKWWDTPDKLGFAAEGEAPEASGDKQFPKYIKFFCDDAEITHEFFSDKECKSKLTGLAASTKFDKCFDRTEDGKTTYWMVKKDKLLNVTAGASSIIMNLASIIALVLAASHF